MKPLISIGLALVSFSCASSSASPGDAADSTRVAVSQKTLDSEPLTNASARTHRFVVRSRVLGEEREVLVRRPARTSEQPTPVLYVTDADWQFPVVAEIVDYLAHWRRIPPMLVVGVMNVARNRDFLPEVDARFAGTGGAEEFLPFLLTELREEIARRYPTSGFDVLFGHSFGGVLALHTLFNHPDAFDAVIAVGTSTWVSDRALFKEARAFFDGGSTTDAMVYMSVGEADGGETVPAGEDFAQLWRERAPSTLEWHYEVVPRANHFTAVVPSLHEALEKLYPTWGFVASIRDGVARAGASAVTATFDAWQVRLGARFFPPVMELNELALELAGAQRKDAARALTQRLMREAPESPEVYAVAGFVEMQAGAPEAALPLVERAIALARERSRFKSRLPMYERLAERLRNSPKEETK